jgi:hypothetical protein
LLSPRALRIMAACLRQRASAQALLISFPNP